MIDFLDPEQVASHNFVASESERLNTHTSEEDLASDDFNNLRQLSGSSNTISLTEQVLSLMQLSEQQAREIADLQAKVHHSMQEITTLRQEVSKAVNLETEWREWRELMRSNWSIRGPQERCSPKSSQSG